MVMTRLYSLAVNGRTIVEVDAEVPDWFPVKPRINTRWLRTIVAQALRRCLHRS
jgi:hypothetical protein